MNMGFSTINALDQSSGISTTTEQVEKLNREFNIYYRDCIGKSIYLLSTRVYLVFAVHKLEKISSNRGKVHFEGLVHLLIYVRDNTTLGLKCSADINWFLVSILACLNSSDKDAYIISAEHFNPKISIVPNVSQ